MLETSRGSWTQDKDLTALVPHEMDPPQYEPVTPVAAPLTPVERLFVRSNLPPAAVPAAEQWTVTVRGTRRSADLSVGELRRLLPAAEVVAVLQCAGNGRRHLAEPVAGTQWANGAAGCAAFTGVRVADLVALLGGPVDEARYLTATGGETAPHPAARVERSVPLSKGLDDCLLAFEMNGAPLPVAHGAPVRLIVPGYFAVNSVKQVTRLALTEQESDADIMRRRYRIAPVGAPQEPSQPTCWSMPVKSWITFPGSGPLPAGPVEVTGVAFAGEARVSTVEVSADGGDSWLPAQLGVDRGPAAWRIFRCTVQLPSGRHVLVSRASDERGDRQPERSTPNAGGYALNGWREPAVVVDAHGS